MFRCTFFRTQKLLICAAEHFPLLRTGSALVSRDRLARCGFERNPSQAPEAQLHATTSSMQAHVARLPARTVAAPRCTIRSAVVAPQALAARHEAVCSGEKLEHASWTSGAVAGAAAAAVVRPELPLMVPMTRAAVHPCSMHGPAACMGPHFAVTCMHTFMHAVLKGNRVYPHVVLGGTTMRPAKPGVGFFHPTPPTPHTHRARKHSPAPHSRLKRNPPHAPAGSSAARRTQRISRSSARPHSPGPRARLSSAPPLSATAAAAARDPQQPPARSQLDSSSSRNGGCSRPPAAGNPGGGNGGR